jgi:hypothetical protein
MYQKKKKLKKVKVIFISLLLLSISHSAYAGCFPREDIYMELQSMQPKTDCLFVSSGSNCIGMLEVDLRNYCQDILVYDGVEMYNYNKYLEDNVAVSARKDFLSLKAGDKFKEEVFYKNNPNKKIILNFEVKSNYKTIITSSVRGMRK